MENLPHDALCGEYGKYLTAAKRAAAQKQAVHESQATRAQANTMLSVDESTAVPVQAVPVHEEAASTPVQQAASTTPVQQAASAPGAPMAMPVQQPVRSPVRLVLSPSVLSPSQLSPLGLSPSSGLFPFFLATPQ